MIVMGIDPGSIATGYSLLRINTQDSIQTLEYGVIRNSSSKSLLEKLTYIHSKISSLIATYHPSEIALEKSFMSKYPQATIILSHVRGAIIATINPKKTALFEYEPRLIKKSIGGTGTLSKKQLAIIIQKHLKLAEYPKPLDASDALGIAYCHLIYQKHI